MLGYDNVWFGSRWLAWFGVNLVTTFILFKPTHALFLKHIHIHIHI